MANEKILVVDDDRAINKLICSYLAKEKFTPIASYDGASAMEAVKWENPDLIILDVMLPDTEGTSLSLEIRKQSNAPILFLSAKSQEIDKIIALSAGGDDYITKPFTPGELIARVKAHLRRQRMMHADNDGAFPVTEVGELRVDFESHECYVRDRQVNLTVKEFDIFRLLLEHPRKVFPASQIFEAVWKTSCMENDPKTVMVYISTLRKKLEPYDDSPSYIVSVRGVGYKFNQSLLPKNQTL
ncbi:MAG: response regulator transcription factor [Firmicutes bacterium]|nr:response regulator transcription factor [Bacillota bacterium]